MNCPVCQSRKITRVNRFVANGGKCYSCLNCKHKFVVIKT